MKLKEKVKDKPSVPCCLEDECLFFLSFSSSAMTAFESPRAEIHFSHKDLSTLKFHFPIKETLSRNEIRSLTIQVSQCCNK